MSVCTEELTSKGYANSRILYLHNITILHALGLDQNELSKGEKTNHFIQFIIQAFSQYLYREQHQVRVHTGQEALKREIERCDGAMIIAVFTPPSSLSLGSAPRHHHFVYLFSVFQCLGSRGLRNVTTCGREKNISSL